jgi:hypothetical protein
MNAKARLAYIESQTVCCSCELEAMKAENYKRIKMGYQAKYNELDFRELPVRFGLESTQVKEFLNDGKGS